NIGFVARQPGGSLSGSTDTDPGEQAERGEDDPDIHAVVQHGSIPCRPGSDGPIVASRRPVALIASGAEECPVQLVGKGREAGHAKQRKSWRAGGVNPLIQDASGG